MLLLMLFTFGVCHADTSVKFAAVIFRHGDRTPVDSYPTDPWRNESLWPVKFGELTNIGKMQHYELGKWLRKRYSHLLSNEFDPAEIYVRSTDVDRTLMSAQANLAGMYPPDGKSMWNKNLMWQPIPIHTVPEKSDEVLAMKKNCNAYNNELMKVTNSKAYKQRLSQYQNLMDYLTAYTGRKVSSYFDILDIYSVLNIESFYNFTLPDWTKSVYPAKMREPACYSFTTSAANPLLARLRAGPLITQIVSRMKKHAKSKPNQYNVTIYSGHDYTIGTILTALGVFDGNCPVYTATILMELIHDSSTPPSVRISYRNSTGIVEPVVLKIPYCGQICPLERFTELNENLIITDFEFECGKQFNAWLGLTFFVGLLICATIYVVHKIYFARVSRRRPNPDVRYTDVVVRDEAMPSRKVTLF